MNIFFYHSREKTKVLMKKYQQIVEKCEEFFSQNETRSLSDKTPRKISDTSLSKSKQENVKDISINEVPPPFSVNELLANSILKMASSSPSPTTTPSVCSKNP
jgi:hypothetical protein